MSTMTFKGAYGVLPLTEFAVGNTWSGIPAMTFTKPSGAGNLDEVQIQFRANSPTSPNYIEELTASGGQVTILSIPDKWGISVPKRVLNLPAGTFYYSVRLIDDSMPPQPYTFITGTIEGKVVATR
jgi:hypothetical protein